MVNYVKNTAWNLFINLPKEVLNSGKDAVKTVLGVAASALSVLTLGKNDYLNVTSDHLLAHETNIISLLYYRVVQVINPNFEVSDSDIFSKMGVITKKIAEPIFEAAAEAYESDKWFIARAEFALGSCVSLITRTADVALGILAGAFSLIPCAGRCRIVNDFAIKQLNLGILQDFCRGIRAVINPQQFYEDEDSSEESTV
jgi:hypothetical protein